MTTQDQEEQSVKWHQRTKETSPFLVPLRDRNESNKRGSNF